MTKENGLCGTTLDKAGDEISVALQVNVQE